VRILVAHNVGRSLNGGMSRIMGFIHEQIADAGHQVEWLTSEDLPARWHGPAARVAFPWLVWHRARREAKAGRPYDLVNVHEPQGAFVAARQWRVTRHGVVVTSHGVEQRAWELALEEGRLGRGGPGLKTRLVYPATGLTQSRFALTHARFVFTLNDTDREYLVTRLGVPRHRVGRMRPGASLSYAGEAARTYDSARRVLFAGTWRKNKGIQDLVPAFTALARRYPDMTLTVLGAGVTPAEVLSAFPEEIRHRVMPIASADEATSAATLAQSDIFLLPSLFEGTPLTLVEAMMAGLPIVTTATSGMKDVLRDGESGLLVPIRSPEAIAAAVSRLAESASLRTQLGLAAHTLASRDYTWPRVAREVLGAYEGLVASSTDSTLAR
jgi:glycosyltransferase involved in cell wall biosynthesis